jgi:hypothetical protein
VRTPEERFGDPYGLIVRCSPQLEDGRSLGDAGSLNPVVARIVSALADAAVGLELGAAVNNELRVLDELTPAGEPAMLSAPAYRGFEFTGSRVARQLADHVIAQLGVRWTEPAAGDEGGLRERSVASVHGLSDLDEFMGALQHDEHGQAYLGTFDRELRQVWEVRRPKAKQVPLKLHDAEESFAGRLEAAAAKVRDRAAAILDAYVAALDAEVRMAVDHAGLGVASDMVESGVRRIGETETTLLAERDLLREQLVDVEARANALFKTLTEAAQRIRTGWLKGINGPLRQYVEAATQAFGLRFALALTEAALAAHGRARGALQDLAAEVAAERHIWPASSDRRRRRCTTPCWRPRCRCSPRSVR